jgi:type I restriction enzyme S subunit
MRNGLPQGWAEAELAKCVDNLDYKRVPVNSDDRSKRLGTVPYYGATGRVGWIDDFLFDEEILLIGEDGAPFLDKSKPISYIVQGRSWVNNHAHVLRARADITTNRYLMYFFNSFDFHDFVNGTTRLKLTQGAMNQIPVRLAPIAEQHRIVTDLQSLLRRISECQERNTRVAEILKRFRQSVLSAACSGRLTADWRAECINDLNSTTKRGDSFDSRVERITETPNGWCWTELQSTCDQIRSICYGVIKLGPVHQQGVPCLRTSDVKPLRIDTEDVKRIDPKISDQFARTILRGGEVLVNVRGTLGGVAVVPQNLKGWNISREVAVVPISTANPEFMAYWIASLAAQNWLTAVVKGVAYSGINIEDLRRLPVALPSKNEQEEIVRRVKNLFVLADKIETRYKTIQQQVDRLPHSILAKAFRGELVPTEAELAERAGRSYESAEQLLQRIRAAKPEKTSTKKSKSNNRRRRAG